MMNEDIIIMFSEFNKLFTKTRSSKNWDLSPAIEFASVNMIPIAPPNSGPNDRDIM